MNASSYTGAQKAMPQLVHGMLTHLASLSSARAGGEAEHQPLRFSEGFKHLCELPQGCVSALVPGCTALQKRMNEMGTRFSPAEWDTLERTHAALGQASIQNEVTLAHIMANHAASLLQTAKDRNTQTLNLAQVATSVLGSRLSSAESKNGATNADRLCNAVTGRYTSAAKKNVTNLNAGSAVLSLRMGLLSGFSFPLLTALTRPEARLSLTNVPPQVLVLGSLANYTQENAFGLREDFPRLHGGSITIVNAQNKEAVYLPTRANSPVDEPVFLQMIADVRGLARSEAQMLRVMHLFSQGGRKAVSMSSHAFPGSNPPSGKVVRMKFAVRPAEDGSIVVSAQSLASNPLDIRQEVRVHVDGSYEVTDFSLQRRSASAMKPAQATG